MLGAGPRSGRRSPWSIRNPDGDAEEIGDTRCVVFDRGVPALDLLAASAEQSAAPELRPA